MDQVIEEHRAIQDHARFIHQSTPIEGELPMFTEVLVGTGAQVRAGFRGRPVKFREQVCGGFEADVGELFPIHIHFLRGQDACAKIGQAGHVERKAADGHGPVMRLPLRVVFGYALEYAARVRDFGIKVQKKGFCDFHRIPV